MDDIKLQSMAHMAILRSPYAHANIRSIDTSAAKAMPGVVAVYVGADIPCNPMPMAWPAGGSAGIQNNVSTPRTLSDGQRQVDRRGRRGRGRRYEAQAFDALDAIVVDWSRSGRRGCGEGDRPGAGSSDENAPNDVVFEWTVGDKAGTDAAVDGAEVVVRQRIVNERLIPNPMEVRGNDRRATRGRDEYTNWMLQPDPAHPAALLAAFVMGIPEQKIRCISPDVERCLRDEDLLLPDYAWCCFASKALGGRAVSRYEGRRESYSSTIHGRDHITYLEIAGSKDGEVTGLGQDPGQPGRPASRRSAGHPPPRSMPACSAAADKIPNVYAEVTGVYTNTTFVDAYRGAGRPEATYVIERGDRPLRGQIGDGPGRTPAPEASSSRTSSRYDNPSGLGTASGGAKIYIDSGTTNRRWTWRSRRPGTRRLDAKKAEAKARRQAAGDGLLDVHRGLRCRAVPSGRRGRRGLGRRDVGSRPTSRSHLTGKVVVTMGTQPPGEATRRRTPR